MGVPFFPPARWHNWLGGTWSCAVAGAADDIELLLLPMTSCHNTIYGLLCRLLKYSAVRIDELFTSSSQRHVASAPSDN